MGNVNIKNKIRQRIYFANQPLISKSIKINLTNTKTKKIQYEFCHLSTQFEK